MNYPKKPCGYPVEAGYIGILPDGKKMLFAILFILVCTRFDSMIESCRIAKTYRLCYINTTGNKWKF